MLFKGKNRIRYNYSRFGYTRGNGTVWHGGIDIEGVDDKTIHMPYYNGKSISGQVVTARIVTDHSNLTWQWGYYVCVKLDLNQTPDIVNYLYFCHNSKNLVSVGQKVKSGDALAIMGNTGNAAEANPPFEHCHFEVRQTATGIGLDPTAYAGFPNEVGTYENTKEPSEPATKEIKGIDVSKYQGNIDWNKVKEDGVEFAMLRLASSNNSGLYIDNTFEQNYNGAKSVGIPVGAYIYSYATTEQEQNKELTFALEALKGKTLEYPLALDIEDASLTKIGKTVLSSLVLRGLTIIDQKGYIPMLYTYTNYAKTYLDMTKFADHDLWIADYRGYNGYGACDMWQYASNGSVNGISGAVDMNICYKEYVKQETNPPSKPEQEEKPEESTPVSNLQELTIGPMSEENKEEFLEIIKNLLLNYSSKTTLKISPVSSGDAMKLWSKAKELGVTYQSKYIKEE